MTSEQIRCFFKVVETGSFTAAAEALYMTQPALSKRISQLEGEIGIILFSRDKSRRTRLTEAGRIVYDGFVRIARDADHVLQKASQLESGIIGTMTLGIFENQIIDEYLQEILNNFSAHYPKVKLHVTTDSFKGLTDAVEQGRLDCAVTIGYDLVGNERLRHHTLYHLKNYLVVPENFMDDTWKQYTLKDFAEFPFLTIKTENHNFQDRMIREETKKAGFAAKFIEATDEKNFMMMLELGKGMAILDSYSKCCNSPNVRCIHLPEIAPTPFDLVWTQKNKNPAFRCFLDYLIL